MSNQPAATPLISSLLTFRHARPDTMRAAFPLCFPDQLHKNKSGRIDLDAPENRAILESDAAQDGFQWLTSRAFKHVAQQEYRQELASRAKAQSEGAVNISINREKIEAEEKGDQEEETAVNPAFVLASAYVPAAKSDRKSGKKGGASRVAAVPANSSDSGDSADKDAEPVLLQNRIYVHPVLASEAPGLALALAEAGAQTNLGINSKLELKAQVVLKDGKYYLEFKIPYLGEFSKQLPFPLPEGSVTLRGELTYTWYIPTGARLSVWLNDKEVWSFKIGI